MRDILLCRNWFMQKDSPEENQSQCPDDFYPDQTHDTTCHGGVKPNVNCKKYVSLMLISINLLHLLMTELYYVSKLVTHTF